MTNATVCTLFPHQNCEPALGHAASGSTKIVESQRKFHVAEQINSALTTLVCRVRATWEEATEPRISGTTESPCKGLHTFETHGTKLLLMIEAAHVTETVSCIGKGWL